MWVYANNSHSQLGISSFVQKTKKKILLNNCRINIVKCKRFGVNLGQRGNTLVEDERLTSLSRSDFGSSSTDEKIDESQIMDFKGFHKDLNSFPSRLNVKPLSAIVDPISDGSKIRVAYQGSRGSYSETAALKAYPICKTIPCDEIESVFKAVELLLVDKGILPVENSVGGSIHQNYDLLLRHKLHIVGEVELVVNHCLELTIQDDLESVTRFLILAKEPIIPQTSKAHKTSIVFTLEEGLGVLIKALAVFAMRNINLSKIESRPQRKCPLRSVDDRNNGSPMYFDHLFYIDFEASMAEPRAQYALNHLQEFTTFLRVLGCYPTKQFRNRTFLWISVLNYSFCT